MSLAPEAAHTAIAYGCRWTTDFPLQLFQQTTFAGEADVRVCLRNGVVEERPFVFANGRLRFADDGLRYTADDGTLLDLYGGDRIEVTPGPEWAGVLPAAFFGTVTASLLAARGLLPLHGSSVSLGDRAVLLCGHSGAGKSTLTAALLAVGARLLSDDLSALLVSAAGPPMLFAGRRAVRLFPDVAGLLGARVPVETLPVEGERKVLALPPVASPDVSFPLAAILVLDADPALLASPASAGLVLLEHGYRRRAVRCLPGHARRVEMSRQVAGSVPVLAFPRVEARDEAGFGRAAEAALRRCEGLLG